MSESRSSRGGIVAQLEATATRVPGAVALIEDERRITYRQLERLSARVAGYLARRGITAGDAVALAAPNGVAWVAGYLGILRSGGVAVAIPAGASGRGVARAVRRADASAVLANAERQSAVEAACSGTGASVFAIEEGVLTRAGRAQREPVECDDDDLAAVVFTPGIVGVSKAAALTHRNLALAARDFAADVCELTPDDVVLAAAPFSHVLGQTIALNAALSAGSAVSLMSRFEPDGALHQLERDDVTVLPGAPAMYRALLQAAHQADVRTPRLARCIASGASLPARVLHGIEETFDCIVLEGYGATETTAAGAFNRLGAQRKPGIAGQPMAGAEIRVADDAGQPVAPDEVGDLVIRGDYVMAGYLRDPQGTARALEGGWFRTGDLGRMDVEGNLAFVDRKDDVIALEAGHVYPRAVEEVLAEHPAVREAAVVEVHDGDDRHEVGAAIVLRDAFDIDPAALQDHVRAHLATHERPRHVWFVGELPRSSTGSLLRREVEVPSEAPEAAV